MNGVDDVGGGGGGDCCRWLHQLLTQESLVSSHTEAIAIVESIRQHDWTLEEEDLAEASQRTVHETFGRYVLCEYFGVPKEEVTKLLQKYCKVTDQDEHGKIDGDDEHEDGNQDEDECHHDMIDYHDENENDDREEVLGPGECELCERDATKLTRHHLIPKSTWKRIEPMLLARWNQAMTATPVVVESSSSSKSWKQSVVDLHPPPQELDHLVPILCNCNNMSVAVGPTGRHAAAGRRWIRQVLHQQTIAVCRPCHNHIHQSYDNRTLALQFNTLGKLKNDSKIAKYAKWASRQHRFKTR